MKTRLVRIGNSRGVRIPTAMLEQVGLVDEIELRVEDGTLVISPVSAPRAGWAEAIAKYGPSELLDPPLATRFDEEEWEW
jgi:antitoxin MazE